MLKAKEIQSARIAEVQKGARQAAQRYLDRNPMYSVEDIEQEVALILFPALESIDSPVSCGYVVGKRLCFKINRQNKLHQATLLQQKENEDTYVVNLRSNGFAQTIILSALLSLEKDVALCVLLRNLLGITYTELARVMNTILVATRSVSYYRLMYRAGIKQLKISCADHERGQLQTQSLKCLRETEVVCTTSATTT